MAHGSTKIEQPKFLPGQRELFDAERCDPQRLDTVAKVIERLQLEKSHDFSPRRELPAPTYRPDINCRTRVMLAVEAFHRHMTDEGMQMQLGLEQAGYKLYGANYPAGRSQTDVGGILYSSSPGVVIVQDQREWDSALWGCFEKGCDFTRLDVLAERSEVFRIAVHKDAQQNPTYHRASHTAFGAHAFIHYYHPAIVLTLCPWMRPRHMIRTWHTVNMAAVPEFSDQRPIKCVLSGSISPVYPLRKRIDRMALQGVFRIKHPGYHSRGACTPQYLEQLSQCKVAVCTASKYGYTLRKMIEATACGCRVITNSPIDDPYPAIDGNMVRVPEDISVSDLQQLINELAASYDAERQAHFAGLAKGMYDYRAVGQRLNDRIEVLRGDYK